MIINPFEFLTKIMDGTIVDVSRSIYELCRQRGKLAKSLEGGFILHTQDHEYEEAILFWIADPRLPSVDQRFRARLIYTELYGCDGQGSIRMSVDLRGQDRFSYLDRFPYIVQFTEGELEGLEFLSNYRFSNLKPVRGIIRFYESRLPLPEGESIERHFRQFVFPAEYQVVDAQIEQAARGEPIFNFSGELPF